MIMNSGGDVSYERKPAVVEGGRQRPKVWLLSRLASSFSCLFSAAGRKDITFILFDSILFESLSINSSRNDKTLCDKIQVERGSIDKILR